MCVTAPGPRHGQYGIVISAVTTPGSTDTLLHIKARSGPTVRLSCRCLVIVSLSGCLVVWLAGVQRCGVHAT